MSKKTEILEHSLNETIIRKMLAIGSTTKEIAEHYDCTLADVRKFIKNVIR